jgi:hypothetical protein
MQENHWTRSCDVTQQLPQIPSVMTGFMHYHTGKEYQRKQAALGGWPVYQDQ